MCCVNACVLSWWRHSSDHVPSFFLPPLPPSLVSSESFCSLISSSQVLQNKAWRQKVAGTLTFQGGSSWLVVEELVLIKNECEYVVFLSLHCVCSSEFWDCWHYNVNNDLAEVGRKDRQKLIQGNLMKVFHGGVNTGSTFFKRKGNWGCKVHTAQLGSEPGA